MDSVHQISLVTADGFNLRISPALAADLSHRVAEAANALPKRGLEVCGLLLGSRTTNTFVAESIMPLPCRYPDGPAFRAGEEELRAALGAVHPPGGVIGFYRSRNDGLLELDHQDRLLINLLPPMPIPVLVIRQQKNTEGEGQLFVWGGWNGGAAVASQGNIFPARQWRVAARLTADPPVHSSSRHAPVEPAPRPPLPDAARRPGKARLAWITAAALALPLPLYFGWRAQDFHAQADDRPTGVAETARAAPLIIDPLPRPPAVGAVAQAAESAARERQTLQSLKDSIRGGGSSSPREHAVRQLARLGKEDPETLPLLGHTAQMDESEAVRVAALESIAGGWQVNPATRSLFEDRARNDKSSAVRQTAGRELQNAGGIDRAAPESVTARPERRTIRREPRRPDDEEPPAIEAPTELSGVSPPSPQAPLYRPPWIGSAPPPAKLTPRAPETSAGDAPEPPAVVPSNPARPAPRQAGFIASTPPVALSRGQSVSAPHRLRRLLREAKVVSLRVAVDPTGRVSRIYPSDAGGNLDQALWEFYAGTVRAWIFKPARRNDEAIAGEVVLSFRVTP